MLLEIRERAQGWVAWAIVILISIPFALWGIQSYLGGGAERAVARVNGTEISERQLSQNVQRTRAEMRERLGLAYDPELFEGLALREQVLDQMIQAQVLLDASRDLGLRVADAVLRSAIAQEAAFQQGGRFDKATYARVLQLQGMTPASFEANLRLRLLETQLERAIQDTAFATVAEVDQSIRLIRQQRDVSFIRLPQADFQPDEPPGDQELQAFFDEHQGEFKSPEQVRVNYLYLSTETLGTEDAVSEADIQALYEERAESMTTPERRELRHILITVPSDADEATIESARVATLNIRERILSGEDFASLASDLSDDPVSASGGGFLGTIERGLLDPSLEQAAFNLAAGELSEPVRSRFGYHLIEVITIEPAAVPPLEDVAEKLRTELLSRSGEGIFFDFAERLASLTYEVPDSLVPAAEELGLEIQSSDWFDRDGGDGHFANSRVVTAAFSDEVLNMGNNSELIDLHTQRMEALVLRVDEHRPETLRPFEDVRDTIVEQLLVRRAAAAALEKAKAMAASIQQGESPSDLAGDAYRLDSPGLIERQSTDAPATVVRQAFEAPRPVDGRPSVTTAIDNAGDAFVIIVSAVNDGAIADLGAEVRAGEARVLAQSLGRSDFSQFVSGLQARARIERMPQTAGGLE